LNAPISEITYRRATPEDTEFLYKVYAHTRYEELALTGWHPEQVEAFLRMQFHAQDTHYRTHYPTSTFDLIELERTPIGRLYLDRQPHQLLIMDIALLPTYRGAGIGTRILTGLLAEAAAAGQRVNIHVETYNPARHLYDRLGFVQIGEAGVYLEMGWTPPASAGAGEN
jgi:ribosomal protein S18 acetylase RimI-like enzyme